MERLRHSLLATAALIACIPAVLPAQNPNARPERARPAQSETYSRGGPDRWQRPQSRPMPTADRSERRWQPEASRGMARPDRPHWPDARPTPPAAGAPSAPTAPDARQPRPDRGDAARWNRDRSDDRRRWDGDGRRDQARRPDAPDGLAGWSNDRRDDRRDWRGDDRRRWADARRGDNDRRWQDGRRWDGDRRWNGDQRWDRDRNGWNRPGYRADWRNDRRYDWRSWRNTHRSIYRFRYAAPRQWGYGYRPFYRGAFLQPFFYTSSYWLADPWDYRLPPVSGPYRWVRYYDDVLLVDINTGEVIDTIQDFFW
jgi:hypothetical protein